jgi:hypothetical protein
MITSEPRIQKKYRLEQASLDEYFAMIRQHATMVETVVPTDADYATTLEALGQGAPEAVRHVGTGQARGKVVINVH